MIDVNEIRSAAIALHGLTGCDFRIRFITTIGTEQPELLAAKAPLSPAQRASLDKLAILLDRSTDQNPAFAHY